MTQPGGYTLAPGAEWTSHAAGWPAVTVTRETESGHFMTDIVPLKPVQPLMQLHLCCALCDGHPSMFCLSPDMTRPAYMVTAADMLSGILGHIRRSHPDVVAS